MTPIKSITNNPLGFKNIRKDDDLKRIRDSKVSSSSSTAVRGTSKVSLEKVNISATGKKLLEQKAEVSRYFNELKNLETIDQKSSELIKNKIEIGYYSKPSIIDKISDALLALPMFSEVPSSGADNSSEIEDKSERLTQIKNKLESGAYSSDEVLDVIVDRVSEFIENSP